MQRRVALVVCEVRDGVRRRAVGLQQGSQGPHAATGGRHVEGGAAPDVSDAHAGPSLEEGFHALLLTRRRLRGRLTKVHNITKQRRSGTIDLAASR